MADNPKRADRQEIARRVERGEKFLQKGKPAEALEEFLQTLTLDPGNDTVRQMAADLCLSLQRLPDAVGLLGELFERQMAAGDAMRASLTYKKLARFASRNCSKNPIASWRSRLTKALWPSCKSVATGRKPWRF